jgi:hypothetical protein
MRRTASGLALAVAALGLGLGGALTGCSSPESTAQLDSGTATAGESSAAPATPEGTASGPPVSGAFLANRVRAAMVSARSARFTVQSSTKSGQDARGVLNIDGGAVRVRFDFTDGADRLRVVSVPGVLYADVGEVVDGRHWLKVTTGGRDPLSSAMAPLLSYMTNSADVSSQTSSWSAAGSFRTGDRSMVGGVPATEYDAVIPRAAVQAGLPPQFRDIMKKDITGDSHLRLWLDGQGRPVRLVTAGSYDHKQDLVTIAYTDWGQAPRVIAPAPADVIRSERS